MSILSDVSPIAKNAHFLCSKRRKYIVMPQNMKQAMVFTWPLQLLCVGPLVRWSFGKLATSVLYRCLT